jgi:membrane fusion protein (multidrug efflux system)
MNIQHSRTLTVLVTVSLIATISISSGCNRKDASKAAAAPPPPTVIVELVEQRTVPIYSEYVGQTKADDTVELRARVEGVLTKVSFKEGAPVRKGQLLFTIDKRPFQATVQSAKAAVAKSNSDLAQARQRTDVIQAQAQLADAVAVHSKTQQDLNRLRPLAAQKAVTEIELDAAIAAEKSAQANVDARQANVTNLEASVKYTIERAQAEVEAAKARLIQAELDLSYCDIYSPISGVIGFQQVDVGNLVGRGDATLLATVSLSNPLLVDFNLSEVEFLKITNRDTVGKRARSVKFELILSDDSKHPEPGSFKVVDRIVDPTTGTVVNAGLEDYKVPTIADLPEVVCEFVGEPDPHLTMGVKGLGEPQGALRCQLAPAPPIAANGASWPFLPSASNSQIVLRAGYSAKIVFPSGE